MGLICLPFSLFLYWLMLRPKKEAPFPKGGLIFLLIAGVVSVVIASLISLPISSAITFIRMGILSDLPNWIHILKDDPQAFADFYLSKSAGLKPSFFWTVVSMFFSAGLLEEGLKFLTCFIATRRQGMIRTWMDSVICFAIVGITFELLENIAFGMNGDLIEALVRGTGCAHYVFGTIMGYFYGKYRVSGLKRYCWLSLLVPILYHTVTNSILGSDLSYMPVIMINSTALHFIAMTVLTVIVVIMWQKNKTLDVPVKEKVKK